ncbi:N-acetylglutaminylglutamine synthetase [Azospirillum rugosum]|uniref:GNAT-family acetyltransferase (TIGR03103 family) n=1 Tax=Azospirillum rugosum TaxID=416170 RepID=A0ABS4SSI3_9PROT|nr:N-acetylglutaminylglutamine synthetase [Azospirillum rugosum]MBP2295515.1 GNAT-family acetyltransferase (TIGR03103 family) [Azospirillum rugosum]MDQ0528394.1 GNAT-family acetyltransferase (TIGR03103 family) [Azospirillum rugosum]
MMQNHTRQNYRIERVLVAALQGTDMTGARGHRVTGPTPCATVECGWGRLLFAHTFGDVQALIEAMRQERPGRRDIALYLEDPHVALSQAPNELFLDPSHTYRLRLAGFRPSPDLRGFTIEAPRGRQDADAVNRIYAARGMVTLDPEHYWAERDSRVLTHLIATDPVSGAVIGSVTGVDHVRAFKDPQNGSSLWCLAVDPQAAYPGIGEALVRALAEHFRARGRSFMDLSVLHDNQNAIALYEKLGFKRVPVFALKTKNPINEKLYAGPAVDAGFNPYAMIIINEARRRGIGVEVVDAEANLFRLSFGGRSVLCRESLSELTSAVALYRCDDKSVTRRAMVKAGLSVPDQMVANGMDDNVAFLERHGSVVVKPARGEQGQGITVDVRDATTLSWAIDKAKAICDTVLMEQFVRGHDVRVLVIDYRVVAAAVRRPAEVVGTGDRTIAQLIEAQSRRRAAATGGESRIPMDKETERCVRDAGFSMDDILPEGQVLAVRKTANLHTGGTLHDITDRLHHRVVEASIEAARALDIPVVGLDLLVPDLMGPDYVIIEANERPGLANHEPQPTAERFLDLLFPYSAPYSAG